jgi:hypothetical protein
VIQFETLTSGDRRTHDTVLKKIHGMGTSRYVKVVCFIATRQILLDFILVFSEILFWNAVEKYSSDSDEKIMMCFPSIPLCFVSRRSFCSFRSLSLFSSRSFYSLRRSLSSLSFVSSRSFFSLLLLISSMIIFSVRLYRSLSIDCDVKSVAT